MTRPKKLIEVALPLDAINEASAHEKRVKVGKPTNIHPWWARRPLATARAVIFAQMVDDPSTHPDIFPSESDQAEERQRLFRIIEDFVLWENTSNGDVLDRAQAEIRQSWRRTCREYSDHPRADELFDPERLPAFHDPFAGGGVLPLEALRLGIESHSTDLNPVSVLISKAMIEIPLRLTGQAPVNPSDKEDSPLLGSDWLGSRGLIEDIGHYGRWIRDQAEERIGWLYPKITITAELAVDREDLSTYVGRELTVISWIWARTARSPDPAFIDVSVPLISNYMLSTKKGKEAYIDPVIIGKEYRFHVHRGRPDDIEHARRGSTTGGRKKTFRCLLSGAPMPFDYLRGEGAAGRLGDRLIAVVVAGDRERVYLPANDEMESLARSAEPANQPDVEFFKQALGFRVGGYGMSKWSDLFTTRQLVALTTLSELVSEAREQVRSDAIIAGLTDDGMGLAVGGVGADAYADALAVYLGLVVSRVAEWNNSLTRWESVAQVPQHLFGQQVISMTWDYCEANPLSNSTGSFHASLRNLILSFKKSIADRGGVAVVGREDAQIQSVSEAKVVSTDPPYFDQIGYADLSDFFYVWLRSSLRDVFPELFATITTPKTEELVATPSRHGSRDNANKFFLDGMTQALRRIADQAHPAFPVTIYYAYTQSESGASGTKATGWEVFLKAVIQAGLAITGTWPIRTENDSRQRALASNAQSSSVILVCQPRMADAPTATRREFVAALGRELPPALDQMRESNIAPIDIAQAAIGPGMAAFSQHASVVDAAGTPLSVNDALLLINDALGEAEADQDGDFDSDSRWAIAWSEEFGFEEGDFGIAEKLAKAKVTSVTGMVQAGILSSGGGKVRLLRPGELSSEWNPSEDSRFTVWEAVHHLVRVLETDGESAAAELFIELGAQAVIARELAYRLFSLASANNRASERRSYNGLVQSWPEIQRIARERFSARPTEQTQAALFSQE